MNMLKNKKGFTLIEMLVVIAIIAVLVAIIIPVVGNSTTKARAAADAANLRSILAEATTDMLNSAVDDTGMIKFTPAVDDGDPTFEVRANTTPTCKTNADWTFSISIVNGNLVAKYGDYTIDQFAYVAENGGTLPEAAEKVPAPTEG